jgi:hypothetical protein
MNPESSADSPLFELVWAAATSAIPCIRGSLVASGRAGLPYTAAASASARGFRCGSEPLVVSSATVVAPFEVVCLVVNFVIVGVHAGGDAC